MTYKTSDGREIEVVIVRKNNKNIYFRVKDDLKLYVTCPIYLSQRSILKLTKENEADIIKMYDKAVMKANEDEYFWYLGKKYVIVLKEDVEHIYFDEVNVYAKSLEDLDTFYEQEVHRVFSEEVEIAKKCFSNLPEFTLKYRRMITRWGVCNRSKNTVTLNTELLKKDITLLDYVIIHELCHFKEPNHSVRFWNHVEEYYPKYKEARKRLRGDL